MYTFRAAWIFDLLEKNIQILNKTLFSLKNGFLKIILLLFIQK